MSSRKGVVGFDRKRGLVVYDVRRGLPTRYLLTGTRRSHDVI